MLDPIFEIRMIYNRISAVGIQVFPSASVEGLVPPNKPPEVKKRKLNFKSTPGIASQLVVHFGSLPDAYPSKLQAGCRMLKENQYKTFVPSAKRVFSCTSVVYQPEW